MVVPLTMPRTRSIRFGGEVAGERAEDRDAAADRGLEAQRRAGPPGDRLELRAVMGDDVLVGGHDALAHRQRGGDQRVGRLVAAHQLDDDVDPVVGDEVGRGVGQQLGRQARGRSPGPRRGRRPRRARARRHRPGGGRRAARAGRATTSRPTVPAPSTATRRRAPLMTGGGRVGDIGRMVADRVRSDRRVSARPLHSRAMTTELAPAPAPLAAPAARAADLLGHPAVRRSSTSATTSARSATTSGSSPSTRRSTASSTTTR